MKSDFSRFLHNFLSHSDVNPQPTPMLSYSGLTRISRWNKFATLFNLDHRVKPDGDREGADASLKPEYDNIVENALSKPDGNTFVAGASTCRGRSMVEMLGVLAIIGVLSVGAIAGYSKAMMKYKLNKQAEQISWLLNAMYRYKDLLENDKPFASFIPILKKLGEIPQEMIKDNSDDIYDAFGIKYKIYANGCSSTCDNISLKIIMNNDYKNFDICNNILETSKTFAAQLDHINIWQIKNDNTNAAFYIMGNTRCSKNNQCLKNLIKNDIYDICQLCADKKGCSFDIQYKMKD